MADIRVRSTDGSNADDGSSWALAVADLHTATTGGLAKAGAGGTCYVSQAHSQTTAAAITLTTGGTPSNPTKIICVSDAADPPTAMATGAVVATGNGAYNMTFVGAFICRGHHFRVGVGNTANGSRIIIAGANADKQYFESCVFDVATTVNSVNARIDVGYNSASADHPVAQWRNSTIKFGAVSQTLNIEGCQFAWSGGGIAVGSAAITTVFSTFAGTARPLEAIIENLDLSAAATSATILNVAKLTAQSRFLMRDCKWPSAAVFTGGTFAGPGVRASAYNCDSGDTNYRLWVEDYAGSIRDETTLVMTGGATDGTTPISWKMVSSANANELVAPLISPEMAVWNETTGVAKTVTVEILHDSATNLTDAEVWLEVSYLGTAGFPLGATASDHRTDILTTAADQTASAVTWTTTGMTSPNKQKLSVTFTPQEKGFFTGRVALAKSSKTIYVDCEMTVS